MLTQMETSKIPSPNIASIVLLGGAISPCPTFSFIIFSVFLIWLLIISLNTKCVFADQLNDSINEQLNNLDLSKLESFFNRSDKMKDIYTSIDFKKNIEILNDLWYNFI